MSEKILWKKPAVIMSIRDDIIDAIVEENQEPEKFHQTEFPKNLFLTPGFTFWWFYVEDTDCKPSRFYRITPR